MRTEGGAASSDVAVNEAYDGLGATYDFYQAAYARNSIDDEGLHLDATVHYKSLYDNAFWNGQQMVFGDGDGELFNRFTIAVDVIGHELTHGVTGDEVGLVYLGQSGALNESVSDVFGSLVKQFTLKQTADQADWLIGAGCSRRTSTASRCARWRRPGPRTTIRCSERTTSPRTCATSSTRRPTAAACTPTRASRTTRSISRRRPSAASRGRRPGASGTRRCATSS